MHAAELFKLLPTDDPRRFQLPITPNICGGPPERYFLFGGAGLAAAVQALETACARPVVWATAQYIAFAPPPSVLELDVHVSVQGHHTSQARVLGHVGAQEIIHVTGALGERPGLPNIGWRRMPITPPPEECPAFHAWRPNPDNLNSRFDVRLAGRGEPNTDTPPTYSRLMLWVRPKEPLAIGREVLAVIGDFVSMGIRDALARDIFGNSLDNTIRYAMIAPTDWVFCDIHIDAVQHGMLHGALFLYAQDGALMAIGNQSLILRNRKPDDALDSSPS